MKPFERFPALLLASLVAMTACGTGAGSAATNHTPLVIAVFGPFTGPDASFGPQDMAGCVPAVNVINRAGGVMGHPLRCLAVDTRGDPADAVPAAQKLLATTPNLAMVMSCTSDEASATVPIFDSAKIPMFCTTGQAIFDHSSYKYFHRLIPPDDFAGYAMAVWAHKMGYAVGASVFGNDISSQGTLPTLEKGFRREGGSMAVVQSLALDQSSYRSEAEQVIAARPQVIFTEADPQTDATFLAELKQLHGLIPTIGADPTLDPNWWKAVSGAIGAQDLATSFVAENPAAALSGPQYDAFKAALLASGNLVPQPSQWATSPYAEHDYDGVIIAALAMDMAKSTVGSVYNSYIPRVTSGGAGGGAVQVDSYKAGVNQLGKGTAIAYVGPGGVTHFDKWGNSPGDFNVDRWDLSGNNVLVGQVTTQEIAPLVS